MAGVRRPIGWTYRASDPEFGTTLGGQLAFPGHTFENIVAGRTGDWDWTYVEVVQGQVKREALLIVDLGAELPPTRAARRIVTGTDELGRALVDLTLPALIVGRTGPYGTGHQVLRTDLDCSPCFKRRCETRRYEPHACMLRLNPEAVAATVLRLWNRPDSRPS